MNGWLPLTMADVGGAAAHDGASAGSHDIADGRGIDQTAGAAAVAIAAPPEQHNSWICIMVATSLTDLVAPQKADNTMVEDAQVDGREHDGTDGRHGPVTAGAMRQPKPSLAMADKTLQQAGRAFEGGKTCARGRYVSRRLVCPRDFVARGMLTTLRVGCGEAVELRFSAPRLSLTVRRTAQFNDGTWNVPCYVVLAPAFAHVTRTD